MKALVNHQEVIDRFQFPERLPIENILHILRRLKMSKRALITGITGQDGSYLTEL